MTYFPTGADLTDPAHPVMAGAFTSSAFKTAMRGALPTTGGPAMPPFSRGESIVATLGPDLRVRVAAKLASETQAQAAADRIGGIGYVGIFTKVWRDLTTRAELASGKTEDFTWEMKVSKIESAPAAKLGLAIVAAVGGVGILWYLSKGKKR